MDNKSRKMEKEIKDIHENIGRSNLVLRLKMQDLQAELDEWQGGTTNGNGEDTNGFMHK